MTWRIGHAVRRALVATGYGAALCGLSLVAALLVVGLAAAVVAEASHRVLRRDHLSRTYAQDR